MSVSGQWLLSQRRADDSWRSCQKAMRAGFVAGIQEILGREVAVFLSASHAEPDYEHS